MEERRVIFEKYEIGRLLGKGTFAKVYYGKNLQSGESVAIKVISKEKVRKEGMIDQIKREISVMRLVRHPNVVELKEMLATKTKIFFVMEYVKGGELFAKVVKGKLPEDVARKYFQQLISAVDFCHSRGVSHRDLKPENLLLDEAGNLKVSDFGLSSLPEQQRSDGLLHTKCGTPAYVAPEVISSGGYDGAKADIWSCGVVLYVLLAGFLPFRDENVMTMYRKIYKAEYVSPPWFSTEAKRMISRMLVPNPEKRISIPAIMRVPWFNKGFTSPSPDNPPIGEEVEEKGFFNAFDLISSMSGGLDLSHLFESERKIGSIFTTKCAIAVIRDRIEGIAKGLNFRVWKMKDCKMKIEGAAEGRKGKLSMTAEMHELSPEVTMVEFSKLYGDTLEYMKFRDEDLRPALKDIVWCWKGDDSH